MRPDAAAGVDGIPARVLRLPELTHVVTSLLNSNCCLGGSASARAPDIWRTSKIVSIPKKGPSTSLENQRGIALECTMPKLLNAILRSRLMPAINPLLLSVQSGFRPGRSTVEQVVTVRSIIEACKTRQRSVSIVFVDFRKAFDSVSRSAIAPLLSFYGVPPVLIAAVMELYRDTQAFVQLRDCQTDAFTTTSGVLQGDTLAPFLFIIFIDYILRRALREDEGYVITRRRSSRHPAAILAALAFADDIALACRSPEAAQRSLNRLCEEGDRVGLSVSAKKTEVLHIGFNDHPALTLPSGEVIADCQDFRYLGSLVASPDGIVADRCAQAWRATTKLSPIFCSAAADALKIRLFRAAVEPILLYGLEAVSITRSREDSLEATHRALLRSCLNIRYPETISNRALATRTRVPPLNITLRQRRLRLLGHVLRAHGRGEANPLAAVILHPPCEPYRRGHGRTETITDTLVADLRMLGLTPAEAVVLSSALFRERLCTGVN
jgi:hypothetical protein